MAKGQKTGGRESGTPNKTTEQLRNLFNELLSANIENLQNDIDNLDPKERITVLLKLSEFVIPKLQSTQMELTEISKPRTIIKWGDKSIEV